MLEMLEKNGDGFAYSLEDIEPFTREPICARHLQTPHKLGQVEWDFVGAQCEKSATLGFIQRSTQTMYASVTVVVRKKDEARNYTDFRQCDDIC